MSVQGWTFLIVGFTFAIYIGIAIWTRAKSTKEFYVAGGQVPGIANGMATAADWMSAASFISMAGLISFMGRDGGFYLMGWTGGYVLLALLLAPYLRKFGKFTVPDFVGDRYYSKTARVVAVVCAIFISFTYIVGQMRGVGIVFARFLEVDINTGVIIGMGLVFFYAVMGGMKGITYTQVAQYCVLIFAYLTPAIFISFMMTGNVIPQLGLGGEMTSEPGVFLLDKLDQLNRDLGFSEYTVGTKSTIDVFFITAALMVGTAGLPHVIIRFYTVPKVAAARTSAGWALFFIAILYTTAPGIAVFSRVNLLQTVDNKSYETIPKWFKNWENSGLIAWVDKNNDGSIQYVKGDAFKDTPVFLATEDGGIVRGDHGQRMISNDLTTSENELYIDRDIMVLANPEIARLPNWVIGLTAAGALAAALSTAAGLLLVISTSFAHDLCKRTINPDISERAELILARVAAGTAVAVAGYFGIFPLGFTAQVVAFAFGLAASSFFPAILMGIFSKKMNREGAITGMIVGILFTFSYIVYFKFIAPEYNNADHWFLGVSPEGIGTVGMLVNFATSIIVAKLTPAPPQEVVELVESIRVPIKD